MTGGRRRKSHPTSRGVHILRGNQGTSGTCFPFSQVHSAACAATATPLPTLQKADFQMTQAQLIPCYSAANAVLAGNSGVRAVVRVDLNGNLVDAIPAIVTIPAETAAATVVKASPGRLCRILITAAGAAPVVVYDNASSASGTIIGITPADPAVGTTFRFDMPAANGITIAGSGTLPGFTLSYQ